MAELRTSHLLQTKTGEKRLEFDVNDFLAAYQNLPPEEFSKPYDLSDEDFESHLNNVQKKYLPRFKNIRRAWSRVLRYLPETMNGQQSYRVLEMSTAHGATLEILRHFGHQVTGNDFSNAGLVLDEDQRSQLRDINVENLSDNVDQEDWPYKPIIQALGLDVILFDAGKTPYPLNDDQFDILICFDALEHYCHPRDWVKVVQEFARVTRKTIVIEINPIRREMIGDESYVPYVQKFYDQMLSFNFAGFQCVATSTSFNQPRFFKLMCL